MPKHRKGFVPYGMRGTASKRSTRAREEDAARKKDRAQDRKQFAALASALGLPRTPKSLNKLRKERTRHERKRATPRQDSS